MAKIPIQPVPRPILCNPYEEPGDHWVYKKDTGKPYQAGTRRPASYFYTTVRTGSAQGTLFAEEERDELPLVNALRDDVRRWRMSGYRGASHVTGELLRFWANPNRPHQMFFCQREAVETIVCLSELRIPGRSSRTLFKDFALTDDNLAKLLRGERPALGELVSKDFYPKLVDIPNDPNLMPLRRMGIKMATGSGKTIVMAMLIAWSFCNRARNPGSLQFPSAVLVCCPNLTVKERLQVLRPENKDNLYAAFDLVPVNLRPCLHAGKVLVENWHGFQHESEHKDGDKTYAVVDKGPETPETLARRFLGDLYDRLPIMVLNDEGHHCWRPASVPKAEEDEGTPAKGKKKKTDLTAEERKELEQDAAEARVWLSGLDYINNCLGKDKPGIIHCIDLSATPFYLRGSGYAEGQPFPWLVSDFGLVDAIESGIVKIPRLPVKDDANKRDEAGRPDPKYFRLYENIVGSLEPSQKYGSGKPKPEALYSKAQGALQQLADQWHERFQQMQQATADQERIPPVLIVVCDNKEIADYFYRKISGEAEAEVVTLEDVEIIADGDEEEHASTGKKTKDKKKTGNRSLGREQ